MNRKGKRERREKERKSGEKSKKQRWEEGERKGNKKNTERDVSAWITESLLMVQELYRWKVGNCEAENDNNSPQQEGIG